MSVTSVIEDTDSGAASLDVTGRRTFTRSFTVLTSSVDDGPLTVSSASGIPSLGQTYSKGNDSDPAAYVKTIRPQRDSGSALVWKVYADYERADITPSSGYPGGTINFELEIPEISIGAVHYTRPAQKDIDGFPIENTCDDPFDPLPEVEDAYLSISISQKQATFNVATAYDYLNAINIDQFWGLPQYSCRVVNFGAQRIYQYDQLLFQVHIEIHIKPDEDKWLVPILNQGYQKPIPTANLAKRLGPLDKVRITDANGLPVTQPVNLGQDGQPLGPNDQPIFYTWHTRKERVFASLNLPELNITL